MTNKYSVVMALDVGERRVGVAWADSQVRIAAPVTTLEVNDNIYRDIAKLAQSLDASAIVVGLPRNQSGEETRQSEFARQFAAKIDANVNVPIVFQDESLTSVEAERRLRSRGKNFVKGDIDSEAAAIILTDYMEANY